MKKIGIFFGSSSGTCEDIAGRIAAKLNVAAEDVHNVADANAASLEQYEVLLLGGSTWGMGDLQDDWESFLPKAAQCNLNGKKVGLFGCGDSQSYSDTFCDSLATIKEQMAGTSCTFVGEVTPKDYSYDETRCEQNGKLIGLLVDEVNESDMTDERIEEWIAALGI